MGQSGEISWVRLPKDLKKRVAEMAEQEHRTLAAQIIVLLEAALAAMPSYSTKK